MSELKKSDELKLKLIQLVKGNGLSVASAARQLGVKERTAQCFFNKEVVWAASWWKDNQEYVDNYFKGLAVEAQDYWVKTKVEIGFNKPPKMNLPPRTKENAQIYDHIKQSIKALHGEGLKIIVIADTQAKPQEDLSYMSWIGKFVNDKKPDVVVHIGDHFDVPSLSSYDKGKKTFEGRRLKADIEAGIKGLELFHAELDDDYHPRLVFCLGNHEQRIDRLANDMPELDGFVGTGLLPLEEMGWEVHEFLKPVEIGGIFFVHYLANPFSGKPYGGSALNQLKTVGNSFVVGHKQCLDVAIRPTLNGKHQIGIVNGACYPFDEPYKGWQGNSHFRGLTVLHEVKDGFGVPMFVSLDFMKNRYES